MPPEYVEDCLEAGGSRIEQLANNFAAALLIPESSLDACEDWSHLSPEALVYRLNSVANHLSVTSSALRWRLAALGKLKSTQAKAIPEEALGNNGHDAPQGELPELFSGPFIDVMGRAIDQGRVSVRRLAGLVDMTIEDLDALFAGHGVQFPSSL